MIRGIDGDLVKLDNLDSIFETLVYNICMVAAGHTCCLRSRLADSEAFPVERELALLFYINVLCYWLFYIEDEWFCLVAHLSRQALHMPCVP